MSEQRVCYISRNYYDLTSAGSKAKTDNEDTLRAMGAINIGRSRSVNPNKIAGFFLDLAGIVRACRLLHRGICSSCNTLSRNISPSFAVWLG